MRDGWIKLHHGLRRHPDYKDTVWLKFWIWLLLLADGNGFIQTDMRSLVEQVDLKNHVVRNFLKRLEREGRMTFEITGNRMLNARVYDLDDPDVTPPKFRSRTFYDQRKISDRAPLCPCWTIMAFDQLSNLPNTPATYVVYLNGILSYVGQTSRFADRIKAYKFRSSPDGCSIITQWGEFREFLIKAKGSKRIGDWAMREIRLIKKLRPRFNETYV